MKTSYDVQVYKIEERNYPAAKGRKARTSYRVRWAVAGRKFGDTFRTKALAESFRAKLITAQREGLAFDTATGLPEPMARALHTRSWYDHAVAYVDLKWSRASAKHRRDIADALVAVTLALRTTERAAPAEVDLRAALRGWSYNRGRRAAADQPPADLADAVRWLGSNTVDLGALLDPAVIRKALDALALRIDGKAAAASTVQRKKAIFSGALRYGVETGHLVAHPFDKVRWEAPKLTNEVDRRAVVNQEQGHRLLLAVRRTTPELEAFFGTLYDAGLRPEESLMLADADYERPKRQGDWGWLHLSGAISEAGSAWTDAGESTEERGLKHRAATAVRSVPAPPRLCARLDRHIERWPPAPNGRLFVTRRGPGGTYVTASNRPLTRNAISTAWRKARETGLTPAELASPLARRPYDLRHACLSYQLSRGISPALVARWAGNSIKVLLSIYATWIYGEAEAAMRRIEEGYEQFPTDPDTPK
ncbi:integrase [Paractinoplanes abujensis]|uniref:Site-specific recombinase XerD n=1 Tax=Paractinoplanes abujensis TaxID=882441 RepID=A0A7W7G3Z7_9ACTN|nr:integrase [Actinoplanes abujensis]MBB4695392.1 site-specific recombinase XerD [Actinoplanes abujensis]GID25000.1 integrase [Actinoplanes abujensis]